MRPSPRLAPVTMTLRIRSRQLAGGRHLEPRHDADGGRHLVGLERSPAAVEELALERLGRRTPAGAVRLGEHYVGDDHGARDRVAPRPDPPYANPRTKVEDRLAPLRVPLW